MRISDWSSDVCSSDLFRDGLTTKIHTLADALGRPPRFIVTAGLGGRRHPSSGPARMSGRFAPGSATAPHGVTPEFRRAFLGGEPPDADQDRSEEHTSELQSIMRISYAVFCLKKKTISTPQ